MNNKTEDLFEGMLIEEDNFFIQVEAESDQQIIRLIGNHFFKKGFVKESYTQAVLDREEIYPTGLEAPGGGIAIPSHRRTSCPHFNDRSCNTKKSS